MFATGTIINGTAIIVGGILGLMFGKLLSEERQDSLKAVCGISVIFIGIAGAMEGMLSISNNGIVSINAMFVTICLASGTLIGEILNIEKCINKFGEWLKLKTGNTKDKKFVDGFVSASLTVSIGAMAVVGAIKDGLYGDRSILATKSILDFIIVMIMASSMGKGAIFSAIPVVIIQGLFTVLAIFIKPILTDSALDYLSLIGSILIFCVGLNLLRDKKIRVSNMLPAIILAVVTAFIPW